MKKLKSRNLFLYLATIEFILKSPCQEEVVPHFSIAPLFDFQSRISPLGKRGHKGGRRHFTDPQAIEAAKAKEEKEKEWRRARGEVIESESEGSDDEKDDNKASSGDDDGIGFKQESSESESESEDEERKPKGAEGLIGQRQNICF